jgi:hypothetical protein
MFSFLILLNLTYEASHRRVNRLVGREYIGIKHFKSVELYPEISLLKLAREVLAITNSFWVLGVRRMNSSDQA